MARYDVSELYAKLRNNEFDFMPRGIHPMESIYSEVKSRFRNLCDDHYTCDDNCSTGNAEPEWHHAVRRSLDVLTTRKVKSALVFHARRNYWEFR